MVVGLDLVTVAVVEEYLEDWLNEMDSNDASHDYILSQD
jgi:hypothetical protein